MNDLVTQSVTLEQLLKLFAGNHAFLSGKPGQVAHIGHGMAAKKACLFGSSNARINGLGL